MEVNQGIVSKFPFVDFDLVPSENFYRLSRDKKRVAQNETTINIFSVASGHLYERFLGIMIVSVMRHTKSPVKFWLIADFLSPSFKV